MGIWLWLCTKRELVQQVRLQQQEIDSLQRQLTAATDFVDAMGWESRARGAQAKVLTESLRKRES